MKAPKPQASTTFKSRLAAALQWEFNFDSVPFTLPRKEKAPAPPPLAPPPPAPAPGPAAGDGALTATARALLQGIGETALAQQVSVRWNPRLRSTAGRAYRSRNLVELNPALLTVPGDEIDRTLRHELAHLVAYRRARKRRIAPHGPEWRDACTELGIPGEHRCHTLDFPRARQRRNYAYICLHCGREIRRVRRIRVPVACFPCCKTYNQGRFSASFTLQERPIPPSDTLPS